jgi:DNA-binding SARP family transcriptional activator/streptogramin lyase
VLVSKLRAALTQSGLDGGTALTAAYGCYRLDLPEGAWVDVLAAASGVRKAESLLEEDAPQPAIDEAALAESIVQQPFLPGDDGPWVQAKRRELEEVRARALTVLAEASLRVDKPANAVHWAGLAVEAEQFRESGYRLLMMAHIAAGNRAEALRVYERCRQFLADELGAYPSPETEAIYRELLETPSTTEIEPDDPSPTAAPRSRRSRRKVLLLVALAVAAAATVAFAFDASGGRTTRLMPDSVVRVDPNTLKVSEVAQVGDAPDLIVAAGGYLWVTNWVLRDNALGSVRENGDHSLWRVDPTTDKAVQVSGGLSPCGLTADPSGDVWVINCFPLGSGQRSNVVLVDRRTLGFKKQILVPDGAVPSGSNYVRGIAYGDGSVWVADSPYSGQTLWQIDPRTHTPRPIQVPNPLGALGWSARTGDLWSTDSNDGLLTRLHESTHHSDTIPLALPDQPDWIAFHGGSMWVADRGSPQVIRLNLAGAPHPRSIRFAGAKSGVLTVAAGAGAIWATTPHDRALWRINPKTSRVTRVALPYDPVGVTVNAGKVWVTVRGR